VNQLVRMSGCLALLCSKPGEMTTFHNSTQQRISMKPSVLRHHFTKWIDRRDDYRTEQNVLLWNTL